MIILLIQRILNNSTIIGTFLGVAGVICIAAGVVLAISSDLGPCATAFWRFLLGGAACGSLTFLILGKPALGQFRTLAVRPQIWIAGVSFGLAIAFWYAGMQQSAVATTSTFHNLSPLVMVLAAWCFIGRRPSLQVSAGLLIALVGAAWLAMQSGDLKGQSLAGDLLALVSAGFMAAFYFCLTRLSATAHPWAVMTMISMISAMALLGVALASDEALMPPSTSTWAVLIALGLCGQVLGQSLLAWASQRIGALGISSITLTEPAFSTLLAALFVAAPFHLPHLFGMGLTVIGLFIILERPAIRIEVKTSPTPAPAALRRRQILKV